MHKIDTAMQKFVALSLVFLLIFGCIQQAQPPNQQGAANSSQNPLQQFMQDLPVGGGMEGLCSNPPECGEFCAKNPQKCMEFCKQHPDNWLCKQGAKEGNNGNNQPKGNWSGQQTGAMEGLCSTPQECGDFCQNNPQACKEYCDAHPDNWMCQPGASEEGSGGQDGTRKEEGSNLPSCDSVNALFSVSPLQYSDVSAIVPLGNLNPPSHTFPTNHIYFYIAKENPADPQGVPKTVPFFAPGNITITRIDTSEHLSGNPPYTDYTVRFSPCRELNAYFGHVSSLSANISVLIGASQGCNEYTTGGERYRSCTHYVDVRLSAGEAIGTTGGRKGQNALDFGAIDLRFPELQYSNRARWKQADEMLHTACPIDYFMPQEKARLEALLGDSATRRTASPVCGSVMQDAAGTAQGIWFVKGTAQTYPEDAHLALVHDNVDPSRPVFSIGTSVPGLAPGAYYYDVSATRWQVNRDFPEIMPDGKIHCFEPTGKWLPYNRIANTVILLQLTTNTSLKIGKLNAAECGSGNWQFSDYAEFER